MIEFVENALGSLDGASESVITCACVLLCFTFAFLIRTFSRLILR